MSIHIYTQEQYDKIVAERNAIAYDNFVLNLKLLDAKKQLEKAVIFPKLEKAYGHTGLWYLYELDYKGDICCTSFEATEEEAKQELRKAHHQLEDKGEIL